MVYPKRTKLAFRGDARIETGSDSFRMRLYLSSTTIHPLKRNLLAELGIDSFSCKDGIRTHDLWLMRPARTTELLYPAPFVSENLATLIFGTLSVRTANDLCLGPLSFL